MREMMQLVVWLAASYAIVCVLGLLFHRHFMYFPVAERVAPSAAGLAGVEEVQIRSDDGQALVAWYAPPSAGKLTVLYFHGNAGNAASRADKFDTMRAGGFGVLLLNNRGYGGSEGSPSEASNVRDAVSAYEFAIGKGVSPQQIVLYGESLGSGQAVQLAGRRQVKAVILEAPLTSTIDIARSTYWFLPLRFVLTDQFRNIDHIAAIKAPILLLHGERDEVIPFEHSSRLQEAAQSPAQLEAFPDGSHSDLFEHGAWAKAVAFVDALPKA